MLRFDLIPLSVGELHKAECYWLQLVQRSHFGEMQALREQSSLESFSPLLSLSPLIDSSGLLRVGGRQQLSKSYDSQHPIILHGKHPLTRLIIRTEHVRLLHAGPTLLAASLACRYHIIGGRRIIRSITRACITCHNSARPQPQMMGQLPIERITPGPVFDKVGIGPVLIKHGHVRRPTVVKAYVCLRFSHGEGSAFGTRF